MPDASRDVPAITPRPPAPPRRPGQVRAAARSRPDFSSTPLAGGDLVLIVVQLVLSAILIWQFELEEKRHLLPAMIGVIAGFLVNVHLPPRWRPAWFSGISVAALVVVLGWSDGLLALSIAGSLIAAARLPVRFTAKVALIVVLAAVFTWMRSKSVAPYWPIVGSMFMFRMISWLHAARKERAPESLAGTAGYFLMLPNSFFPLFPVVDAGTFRETWYNEEPRAIYQTGVRWIAAGLLHLLLYRVIKYDVLPSPLGVRSLQDVMLYLAANYALYLRVSGHFHLICGMLHLFGWNLPRTHDHYFLAASFSEIWRRINIYWKDFLMKTFFYPAFFWLRGRLARLRTGDAAAIAVAVLWVFFWTWLAHSWQMFWRTGLFPFQLSDGWMWLAVGVLVAGNAVFDYRVALRPRKQRGSITWTAAAIHSLQIMGMFLLVSLFWAGWTNVETFRYVIYVAISQAPTTREVLTIAGAGFVLFAVLTVGQIWLGRRTRPEETGGRQSSFDRQAALTTLALVVAALVAAPGLSDALGPPGGWVQHLQTDRMSSAEAMTVVDGYYEQLNQANPSRPYHEEGDLTPNQIAVDFGDMIRRRNDLLELELIPGWKGSWNSKPISINRWGMRDRDRTLVAGPNVLRIAAVGSSLVMGFGVGDDETFASLLEKKLNASALDANERYEVLNFGVGRYSPLHRSGQIEHKMLAFRPDLVMYFAHEDEIYTSARRLAELAYNQVNLEDHDLQEFIQSLQIAPGASEATYQIEVEKHHPQILALIYRKIRRILDEAGIPIVFVYMPIPGEHDLPFDPRVVLKFATDAGFPTIDLSHWWENQPPLQMILGTRDHHPTPRGHQFVAKHLFLRRQEFFAVLRNKRPAGHGLPAENRP